MKIKGMDRNISLIGLISPENTKDYEEQNRIMRKEKISPEYNYVGSFHIQDGTFNTDYVH